MSDQQIDPETETETEEDTSVHLRLPPAVAAELDQLIEHLKRDHTITRLRRGVGRPMAIRWAIGRALESLTAESSR